MNPSACGSYARRSDLEPLERWTAVALAIECDRWDWHVTIAQRDLRRMTGLTPLAQRRALDALERKGAIQRFQRHRRAPTEYTLTPHIRR